MRRRDFIAGLGGAAAAMPLIARAQQQSLPVIGWLSDAVRNEASVAAFRQGLGEVGFIEGRNVAIEYRWADNQTERVAALAADLVRRRVAVLAVSPNPATIAPVKAVTATTTIPIVFLSGPDPVASGLVASLNRPGGNLTGVSLLTNESETKRFGLLHTLVPQAKTVALLVQRRGVPSQELKSVEAAGHQVGVQIVGLEVNRDSDFDAAFETARREGAGAIEIASRQLFIDHRGSLITLAANYNLPAIYAQPEFVEAGGLMSYSTRIADAFRWVGVYTGRVLNGEKPADLPVMLPTKFEFFVNLRTAKSQKIEIPPQLLAIADRVIE